MFLKISTMLALLSLQSGHVATFNIMASGKVIPDHFLKRIPSELKSSNEFKVELHSKNSDTATYSQAEIGEIFGIGSNELRSIVNDIDEISRPLLELQDFPALQISDLKNVLMENNTTNLEDAKSMLADFYQVSDEDFDMIAKKIVIHNSSALEESKKQALSLKKLPVPERVRSQKWVSYYLNNLPEGTLDALISLSAALYLGIQMQDNFKCLPTHAFHLVLGLVIADFVTAHFHWFEDTYDLGVYKS